MTRKPKLDPHSEPLSVFIADPFHLPGPPTDSEMADSDLPDLHRGDDTDELEFTPEEVHQTLEGIAEAIAEEDRKHQEELNALTNESAESLTQEMAEQLAREIAEDESLTSELHQLSFSDQAEDLEHSDMGEQPGEPRTLDLQELQGQIEALLFMSDKPIKTEKLQELLGPDQNFSLFQEAITQIRDRYQTLAHGIEIVEIDGGFQMRTKLSHSHLAKKLARVQVQRLSSGAMETLAIIAFKQPLLKEEVDKIRGVDSSHFIRTLLDRKLICISGRSDLPGRPMLYTTTSEFLELFSLKDLSDLPPLREVESMIPQSESKNPEDEDPRVKEMRKLVHQMKTDVSTTLKYDPREDEKFLKDIREKVQSIATTTPYLEQQKALEQAQAAGLTTQTSEESGNTLTGTLGGLPADSAQLALHAQIEVQEPNVSTQHP